MRGERRHSLYVILKLHFFLQERLLSTEKKMQFFLIRNRQPSIKDIIIVKHLFEVEHGIRLLCIISMKEDLLAAILQIRIILIILIIDRTDSYDVLNMPVCHIGTSKDIIIAIYRVDSISH